nr:mediator of RNA polymerase II transcription subunit 15-like [Arachis hypogaea]
MRPVPSQEYWKHDVDTLPILPPRYRKPIGRPTLKRDKRNDGPKEKSDPHRTSRRIGIIICKYCLQAGHNKRSCKKQKEAAGEGSSAPQAPADDEDEDLLAEMYYEETLESAQAEQEATEEGNESARTNTQQQPHPMPPPPTAQPQPQPTNATTRKQVTRRSVKRPPPTGQRQQPSTPATNQPATTPSTHNSQTTPHPLQGASAGTSTRFMLFMPTPGVVTPTATGGTSDRARGQGRGRGRIRGSSGGKNGLSSGSSNSTPIS